MEPSGLPHAEPAGPESIRASDQDRDAVGQRYGYAVSGADSGRGKDVGCVAYLLAEVVIRQADTGFG